MHETMRHRMERFVILPFSVGCVSQSSVAVSDNQPKMTHAEHNPSPKGLSTGSGGGEDRQSFVGGKAGKPHPLGVLALPRPGNISAGLQRLIKSFRGLSQLFTLHRGEEDDGEEMEMQIGFPTDVKHVAHIGWDGSSVGGPPIMKSWDRGPDLLALPSISLRQFEAAMAAPAAGPLPLGARCLSRSRFIINN